MGIITILKVVTKLEETTGEVPGTQQSLKKKTQWSFPFGSQIQLKAILLHLTMCNPYSGFLSHVFTATWKWEKLRSCAIQGSERLIDLPKEHSCKRAEPEFL